VRLQIGPHSTAPDGLLKCKAALERAIELDPFFSQPHLDLAELYRHFGTAGSVRPRDLIAVGRAAIDKALGIDASSGEAYALSGAYRAWADFDWPRAEADFERALELAPGSSLVHTLRATYYLVPTRRLSEAEAEMSDPVSPFSYMERGRVRRHGWPSSLNWLYSAPGHHHPREGGRT
jgi:tetratricopeptide (TPR) repeat protein